jgi:predicted RecA/RadA family phage recombinase
MKNNNMMLLVVAMALVAGVLTAATNYIAPGDVVTLTWAKTSPSKNAPVVKCASKATGGIIGVAMDGAGTAGENVRVATKGIFDLSVTTASGSSIAIGDYVYGSVAGDVEVCTTTLSNTNTGLIFGQAMEAITGSSSGDITATINVKLLQPSHL